MIVYENAIGSKPITSNSRKCKVDLATSEDLVVAMSLLRDMVKAQAELASGFREGAVIDPIDLIKKETAEWSKFNDLRNHLKTRQVEVPIHPCGVKGKVLKVALELNKGYGIPDPMLLMMKADINWHFINTGKKLLSTCGPPVDPVKVEIEAINDELYEELLEEAYDEQIRPQSRGELAKGLGQWTPSNTEQGTSVPRVSLSPDEATKKSPSMRKC